MEHLKFKKVSVISPRDFVNVTFWRVMKSGEIRLMAMSITDDGSSGKRRVTLPPPTSDFVRGHLTVGGWVLQPVKRGNQTWTRGTYLMESNIKGSIPQWVVRSAAKKQGEIVVRVAEVRRTMAVLLWCLSLASACSACTLSIIDLSL